MVSSTAVIVLTINVGVMLFYVIAIGGGNDGIDIDHSSKTVIFEIILMFL